MQFDTIPRAEKIEHYMDVGLRRGRVAAAKVKKISDPVVRLKAKERDRIRAINESIPAALVKVHDAYPSFDKLGEFTLRVFSLDMDPGLVKQALGGIKSNAFQLKTLAREQIALIGKATNMGAVQQMSKGYLGRLKSILRQTEKHINVLNEARLIFRKLPAVDESLFTVAIAGFPNVGKSTLLGKLTSAEPDVQPYAFTTKGLNVGYFTYKYNKIQCIDTPGTLNREYSNSIEEKADAVLKYAAQCIVYVFDPTESYPLAEQLALYKKVLELDVPVFVYVSKTDIASAEHIPVDDTLTDVTELKKLLTKEFTKWV